MADEWHKLKAELVAHLVGLEGELRTAGQTDAAEMFAPVAANPPESQFGSASDWLGEVEVVADAIMRRFPPPSPLDEKVREAKRLARIREKTAKGYRSVESSGTPTPVKAPSARRAGNGGDGARGNRARPASSGKEQGPRARLRAAFKTLNSMRIVALENAGYTQSDGWDDVNEIASRLADSGKRPRAGVFYHGQDVARGRRGEGLMLTFGSYAARDADADSIAVGHIIVDVLKSHGFQPKWDGSVWTRIHTGRFEWK